MAHAASATWTPIASMTDARYAAMAASSLDGRIFVFGGLNNLTLDPASEAYDPGTDTWTGIARSDRRFLAGVARGTDGRIYLIGGTNLAEVLNSVVASPSISSPCSRISTIRSPLAPSLRISVSRNVW